MTKHHKFILAVCVQVLIIFSLVMTKSMWLKDYHDVMLRVYGVDPRDPLRGDYITLNYEIGRLYQGMLPDQKNIVGRTFYLVLRKQGSTWQIDDVSFARPTLSTKTFIKGVITNNANPLIDRDGYRIEVRYGIEDYFIPEGKGQEFNRLARSKDIFAKVRIDKDGNAVLKQLYVDNKPWP